MQVEESEKKELVKNFDQFNLLKHSHIKPTAFTERGLYMLATILKSDQAVETTLAIIDTFAEARELARTMEARRPWQTAALSSKASSRRPAKFSPTWWVPTDAKPNGNKLA